jgi:hypothetical protein
MMGEQVAWIVVFAVVVPILFAVLKLAWSEHERHEEICRRLSLLEKELVEQSELLERASSRR